MSRAGRLAGTAAHHAARRGYAEAAELPRQILEEEQRTGTKRNGLFQNYIY